MPSFPTVVTMEGALALISLLLVHSIPLSRSIDVHVDNLVVHSLRSIGGVVSRSRLEVKMIEEIASE